MGEHTTLVPEITQEIFHLILSGEIPLGGELNEVALAARFNVSRGPVREAVKVMEGRGLVVKQPYYRARVVTLDTRDMKDIFQLRESVEGMSVRLATQTMNDASMKRMLFDFEHAEGQSELFDLHKRIAEECGNPRIKALLCDELYYLVQIYRFRSGADPERQANAKVEHWRILRAMRARDAELAESLMREHIARATSALEEIIADEEARPVRLKRSWKARKGRKE